MPQYLITLISGQLSPNFFSVKLLAPQELVLVHTQDTRAEAELLADLVRRKSDYGVQKCTKLETAPFHPGNIRATAQELLARLIEQGVAAHDIILNYTGGTKPMAIQFVEVFSAAGAQLLYIDTQQETCWWTSNDELSEKPLTLKLDIPEMLALWATDMPDQTPETLIDTLAPLSAFLFEAKRSGIAPHEETLPMHQPLLDWLAEAGQTQVQLPKYGYKRTRALETWEPGFQGPPQYELYTAAAQKPSHMQVRFRGTAFEFKKKEFWLGYFVGGWFEHHVFTLLLATGAYDDIRCNVRMKMRPGANKAATQIKNEVDVLAIKNGIPVFVECKSGVVNQKSITNLKIMADTYGGRYSEMVLVSLYPVKDGVLREKIKENNITLLDKARKLPEELARLHEYMLVRT